MRINVSCAACTFSVMLLLLSSTFSCLQGEAQTKRDRSKSSSQGNKGTRSAEGAEFSKLLDIMIADMEAGWDTVVHSSREMLYELPDVQKDWSSPLADGVEERMMRVVCSNTPRR